MAEKKQFKTESKKLMDLMINSIYTNKEIFLRELISNASDAIDKLRFKGLTDNSVEVSGDEFGMLITLDKDARTITLSDNGIGMTKDELENNLGTIAKSGSLDFKTENESDDIDIIGQFGVGFYSAFMVASKVTVISRAFGNDEAWIWESSGADGYTITETQKDKVGTEIIMELKPDTEEESYSEFLEDYRISGIVKKYSDYVRYPIKMYREKTREKERPADAGEDYKPEYEKYTELDTLNSMVPLWKRSKKDVTNEEYNSFYKDKFMDYSDPSRVIVTKTEGAISYNALLFIPSHAPYDYYTREYEKGLQLYTSGVMIMDKCADLLPDYFSFVKGVVDSQDLSLNISREMLQQDRQLTTIRKNLEKKIKNELSNMRDNERDKYTEFWTNFGRQLKFGCYNSFGQNSDMLKDLLMFYSAREQKMITLKEYVDAMGSEQKYIYYAAGESTDRLVKLPAAETVLDKDCDLLLLTEDVDEFCLQILNAYEEKPFKNINSGDLELETEEEKKAAETAGEESKELLEAIKTALDGKVKEVKISTRLKDHPVCLTSEGPLSIEMEKVLASMPGNDGEKPVSDKVLELNASHPVFEKLKAALSDAELLKKYADILYNQARLIEGLPIEDPVEYTANVCSLM